MRSVMSVSLLILTGVAAWGTEPDSQTVSGVPELVRLLDDPSFSIREEASLRLLQIGISAKDALEAGCSSPSAEVRRRCDELLHLILEADLQTRIDTFLQNPDTAELEGLPGLARFRELVGTGEGTRELYVSMLQEHGHLLGRIEREPSTAGPMYADLARDLYQRQRAVNGQRPNPPTQADVIAFLFLGTDPNIVGTDVQHLFVSNALRLAPLRQAMTADDAEASVIKQLLAKWAEIQTNPSLVNRVFGLALSGNVTELLPFAIRQVEDANALGTTRAFGLLALGKFGAKDQMALIEPLLEEKAILAQITVNGVRGTTELRDVALAVSIHLDGGDVADYGFDMLRGELNFTTYYYLGFSDDDKRTAAFERWREENSEE